MEKKLSQEDLKLIACITMLLDHVGAVFRLGIGYRIVGRLAFPIYCFLMAEGVAHTKNHRNYGLRLALGAILAELPFDLAFSGGWNPGDQSVMLTLLFGFLALEGMRKAKHWPMGAFIALLMAALAELLETDYGGMGVLLIVFFWICRNHGNHLIRLTGMLVIFYAMNSLRIPILGFRVPIEMFAILSLVPIGFYSGKKTTGSKVVEWLFYSFYPLHLLLLAMLHSIL